MATKAELTAELKLLKEKMAQADAAPEDRSVPAQSGIESRAGSGAGSETAAPDTDGSGLFASVLKQHGIAADDIDELWKQFSSELGDLAEKKPLVTAIAAFALGFVVGRMSK